MKNPGPIVFGEGAKGNIITMQERSPEIVVFYIKTFPAAGRHLVHETEDAPVSAPRNAERGKLQPEIVIGIFIDNPCCAPPVF